MEKEEVEREESRESQEKIKQERRILTKMLIDDINRLRTKTDVVAEPFIELKMAMGAFAERIIPVLQDYNKLQLHEESLNTAVASLRREVETLKAFKESVEKKEKEVKEKAEKGGEQDVRRDSKGDKGTKE